MALTHDFSRPALANDVDTDLGAIRDNFWWLASMAASGCIVMPGWTTTVTSTSSPLDYSQPNQIRLTKGSQAIEFNYTWSSGNVTQIVVKFDDGISSPSLTTVTGGTITLTYDGSGNFTGATTA